MELEENLTEEQLKLYDRQRFIGLSNQKKLLQSTTSEFAKNLILLGANIDLYDDKLVDEIDVQSNFLLSKADIGQELHKVVGNKLKDINPTVKIETYKQCITPDQILNKSFSIEKYSFLSISCQDFKDIENWNNISRQFNKPLFAFGSLGHAGYYFTSLGKEFSIKQKENIKDIPTKQFQNSLDLNKRLAKPVYYALCILQIAEKENVQYKPKNLIKNNSYQELQLKQLIPQGYNSEIKDENYIKIINLFPKNLPEKIKKDEKKIENIKNFIAMNGLEIVNVYSIMGSVASQEFIKIIGRSEEPAQGWFVYDSLEGYGQVEQ